MEKTIGSMAGYMKRLLPMDIPEDYVIDPRFTGISKEDKIREGLLAFKDFMLILYDNLINDKSLSDTPIKGKHKYSDETTLTVEFPFINNIKSILINIGDRGILSDQGDSIIVKDWDSLSLKRSLNKNSTTKIPSTQMMKSLRFLQDCGLCFSGVDLSAKKPDLKSFDSIEVTYPEDLTMLIGLKVLAYAQNELGTRKNDDILMRCDYRILNNEEGELTSMLNEFVRPLSKALQSFILSLHEHYLESNMTCHVEKGFLCTHFIYSFKRKALWRLSLSYHNGYRLVLKTKKMDRYAEIINTFPDHLKMMINKGYGCDRKTGTGHGNCQKGCEGFRFSLDDSILDIGREIKEWQDCELNSK